MKDSRILGKQAGDVRTTAEPDKGTIGAGWLGGWVNFWFTAISPLGLHSLRVLTGLLLLAWALPFAGQVDAMFSLRGWMDTAAYEEASRLADEGNVPIGWSVFYVTDDPGIVRLLYWGGVAIFGLFTLGIASRVTAVLTWVMVLSMMANPATRFEAEYLLSTLAFYLMIGYVLYGQWNGNPTPLGRIFGPRDAWLLLRRDSEPRQFSYAANLAVRLLQIHFAIIVVTSAFHKLQFGSWWSGVAFWYPLHSPFTTTEEELRSLAAGRDSYLFVLSLVEYVVLAWQVTLPLFAWRTGKWRYLLLGGGALGWIGSLYIYKAPLFGPAFLIGYLSYLTPAEWHWLRDRLTGSADSAAESARNRRLQPAGKSVVR